MGKTLIISCIPHHLSNGWTNDYAFHLISIGSAVRYLLWCCCARCSHSGQPPWERGQNNFGENSIVRWEVSLHRALLWSFRRVSEPAGGAPLSVGPLPNGWTSIWDTSIATRAGERKSTSVIYYQASSTIGVLVPRPIAYSINRWERLGWHHRTLDLTLPALFLRLDFFHPHPSRHSINTYHLLFGG